MLLQAVLFQGSDDGLGGIDGPQVLDDDLTVRHDEDDSRILADAVLAADGMAAAIGANGGIFHAIIGDPILAGRITIRGGDFHIEHVMHVTAHGIVGFDNLRRGLLARAASGEEEVDEHSLTAVEDVEQVDLGAVAVGSRKVYGFRVGALRFQAKTDGQREHKGKEFFHIVNI